MKILGLTSEENIAASIYNRQTKNVDAYRLYVKGSSHYHKWWSEADLRLSLDYYRKALDRDPDYALAHGGLALSYMQLGATGAASFEQIKDSALVEAQKALAIDNKLPEAHLALTGLKYSNFESAASIEEGSKQTIHLNPSYADAIHFYAHWLSETRKPERAIEMMLRSVEYEPLNPHFQNCVGIVYGQARRWVESQAAFKKLFEMDSAYFSGSSDSFLYNYAFVRGDTAAVIMYRKKLMAQYPADSLGHLALINAYMGRISIAQEYMRKFDLVPKSNAANARWKAYMFAAAKNKQETLQWLEAMYKNRDGMVQWVNTDPAYDFLIGDPRFEALMKKAGYRD